MTVRTGAAALVSLVAIALAALAWFGSRGDDRPDPAAELARLVPGHRPLLARTSLATPHAPFDPAAPPAGPAEREAIYARLLAAKVDGAPGAAAALAAFYAARAEPGDAERALAEAVDPVDRGAVLLALDRPDEALEEFAKALAARPDDPAARFGRSLALEALLLEGQALQAWEAFLAVAGDDAWADEGGSRLASLRAPPEVRTPSLEERKREAVLRLYEPRPKRLDELRPVARALADAGDRLLQHELDFLDGLDEAGWRRREAFARRLATLRAEVFAGRDRGDELRALAGAEEPLFGVKALHFAAYGAIVRGDRAAGERLLGALRNRCTLLGCAEELGLVESDLGTLRQREGDYAGALAAFERARRSLVPIYEARLGELDVKQADVELRSDSADRALRRLDGAIRTIRRLGWRDLAWALTIRGRAEEQRGRSTSALAYWAEAAAVARENGDAHREAEAVRLQATALVQLGRRAEGLQLLEETIARLRATDLRPVLALSLAGFAKLADRPDELRRGREAADEALTLAREAGVPLNVAHALEARAEVARREGDAGTALRALREAVALDQRRAAEAPGTLARLGVEAAASPRRLLLALLLGESDDAAGAFAALAGGAAAGLHDDECRLGVGQTEDRLFAVAVGASGPSFVSVPLPAGGTPGQPGLSPLLEAVLGKVSCLDASRRVSVLQVPGSLSIPAVRAVEKRRPGLLVAVATKADARWPGSRKFERALVVHDPAVRGPAVAPALPGAAREAERIRAAFATTVTLSGEGATPQGLRAQAPSADLMHLAVHGISRSGVGSASYLLLAGDPGRLQVVDVLGLELEVRKPLVVLSACRSAGVTSRIEDDGAGLPWAFLEAGASAVLAGEGELDDRLTEGFARAFYSSLAEGLPVAEAAAAATVAFRANVAGDGVPSFVLYF